MAGRRQPVELLLVKGKKHLTKQEIEERQAVEIKAPSENIRPPTYLSDELKKEFKKIANELKRIDIISNLDVETLARYLMAQEQYVKASLMLRELDPLDDEYAKLLNSQDKLFKQCRSMSQDLGLTISSRCKLVVPKKEEPKKKSEEEEMFGDAL